MYCFSASWRRLGTIAAALSAAFLGLSAPVAADELKREPLNGPVYGIIGSAANVSFSAGADGVFVVDSGERRDSRAVLGLIEDLSHAPLRYLVNTNAHPAHTGGNPRFAGSGAVIVAHEEVRRVLEGNGADDNALPTFSLPQAGRMKFEFNGETIEVFHVAPAHAPGNLIVHYQDSNVIHMGELFSPVSYPTLAGGTVTGFIRALDQAVKASDVDTIVVPAQGPISDREGMIAYREMLIAIRDRVIDALDQGQTLEQFVALRPTVDFDPIYGDPSDPLFLPVIYEELSLRRQPAGQYSPAAATN